MSFSFRLSRVITSVTFAVFAGSLHAEDIVPKAATDSLKAGLSTAVAERFSFVDSAVKYEPVFRNRYWLATIEATKPGKFRLQVDLKQDLKNPKTGEPAGTRDEEYQFELSIARRGFSRLVSRSATRAWCMPLACVGDRLVIPIRLNPNDHSHRFKLTSESILVKTTVEEYLKGKDDFTKMVAVEKVKLQNGAAEQLKLIAGRTSEFANMSKSVWYHDLDAVFQIKGADKFNLKTFFNWPAKPGRAAEFGLDIRDGDKPITVTVGYWRLFYNEAKGRTERGAMQIQERVTQVRVGDTLWLNSPETPGSKSRGSYNFPTLVIEKLPLEVKKPVFVDKLPDDTLELDSK